MTVYCMEILFLVWQQQHVNNMGSSLHLLLQPFFCFTKFVKGQGLTRIVWKRVNAMRLNVVFAFVALLRIVSYCTMYMKQTPWALSKNAFAGTWKSKSTFLEFSHFKRALTLNEKIFFPTLSAHSATLTKKEHMNNPLLYDIREEALEEVIAKAYRHLRQWQGHKLRKIRRTNGQSTLRKKACPLS